MHLDVSEAYVFLLCVFIFNFCIEMITVVNEKYQKTVCYTRKKKNIKNPKGRKHSIKKKKKKMWFFLMRCQKTNNN